MQHISRFSFGLLDQEKILLFLKQYGKHVSTTLFIVGFILDFLFLPEVTHPLTPYIGLLYTLGFGLSLLARSYLLTRAKGDVFTNKLSNILSLSLAFFSGSVLSFIFVSYFRSSYLAGAVPFFLFTLFVIFSNEYIHSKKLRTYLDVSIYYFVISALSIFFLPFIVRIVSNTIFLVSLFVAIILSLLYSYALNRVLTPNIVQKRVLYLLPLWAPCAFAFLYFTNSIPPLPLSITSAKVYHGVEKVGNVYEVKEEVRQGLSTTYHVKEGKPLYFFTTVFAPALLVAPVEHVWERYDESLSTWKEVTRVSFTLSGGREEGYRGYSYTTLTAPGKWRVSVYLDYKRLLGRHYFSVESSDPASLKEVER